jgi:phosphohistidine phosphatase
MRLLTIVRHADASWDYPELSDFERPLSQRGRRDLPRVAFHALKQLGPPDQLISSPATRALATARAFAGAQGLSDAAITLQPRIYEASGAMLLSLVRALGDEHVHVMIFGHNPGLSELAHRLADCPFDDLQPAALVQIALDIEHWREAAGESGTVRHYATPHELGD